MILVKCDGCQRLKTYPPNRGEPWMTFGKREGLPLSEHLHACSPTCAKKIRPKLKAIENFRRTSS